MKLAPAFALPLAAGFRAAMAFAAADIIPVYAPPELPAPASIKTLSLRAPSFAASWAIQFGPGSGDVLLFVADCEARHTRHDRLYVRHAPVYPEPTLLAGRWKDGAMRFNAVRVESVFDKTSFKASIEPEVTTDWKEPVCAMRLTIEVSLRGDRNASYALIGNLPAAMGADKIPPCSVLLARPSLKSSWDRRTDPPSVRGVLNMGDFRMLPDAGFTAKGRLDICGPDGATVDSSSFRVRPSPQSGYFLCGALRNLKSMTPYTAKVSISLSPLVSSVESSASTVLREK